MRILIQLLRRSNQTLRRQGMGACKFVKNEEMLGLSSFIIRSPRLHHPEHSYIPDCTFSEPLVQK